MEVWLVSFIKYVFNDDPRFALLAAFVIIFMGAMHKKTSNKTDKVWERLRVLETDNSEKQRRLDDHADHFDVLRRDMDRNLDIANNANKLSTKAVEILLSALKRKPEL
jgi:hypothetical protein